MNLAKKIGLALLSIVSISALLLIIDKQLEGKFISQNQQDGIYFFTPLTKAVYQTGEFRYTAGLNSIGFRGNEFPTAKNKNSVRIMVVGDSFSFGWGVAREDSYPVILEKELARKIGKKVEVLNFSRPGYGPLNYGETASKFLKNYKPDYLLIGLVEGDDLASLIPSFRKPGSQSPETKMRIAEYLKTVENYPTDPALLTEFLPNITRLISRNNTIDIAKSWKTQLTALVNSFTDAEISIFEALDEDIRNKFLTGYIQPWIVLSVVENPDAITGTTDLKNVYTKNAINRLNFIVKEIAQSAASIDTKTFIVDIPYNIFISEKYAKAQKSMGLDYLDKSWESDIPELINKQLATSSGAKLISNIKFMRSECPSDCYYLYDSHLNKKGHRIIASRLVSEMEKIIKNEE